jgi:hypothetical protein
MTPLDNVNRLYGTYVSMGFGKDVIVRKLKAQFKGARFQYKGSTLYVTFGDNAPQKVTGSRVELNAATRLLALSYDGNIGMMEMVKFYKVATPEQKEQMKGLIADKKNAQAWQLLQDVTGVKLH